MVNKKTIYGLSIFCIGVFLLTLFFSTNYDEYGILDKQYIDNISDFQNCLIIETFDSQYSYIFGLYTVVDKTPKTYYFRDEHVLNAELLKYEQVKPLIIKIHWVKSSTFCCINGIEVIGPAH